MNHTCCLLLDSHGTLLNYSSRIQLPRLEWDRYSSIVLSNYESKLAPQSSFLAVYLRLRTLFTVPLFAQQQTVLYLVDVDSVLAHSDLQRLRDARFEAIYRHYYDLAMMDIVLLTDEMTNFQRRLESSSYNPEQEKAAIEWLTAIQQSLVQQEEGLDQLPDIMDRYYQQLTQNMLQVFCTEYVSELGRSAVMLDSSGQSVFPGLGNSRWYLTTHMIEQVNQDVPTSKRVEALERQMLMEIEEVICGAR